MRPHAKHEEVLLSRPVTAIQIPEGEEVMLQAQPLLLTQSLGGSFTVQARDNRKYRIEGRDGPAIGKDVPANAAPAVDPNAETPTPEEAKERAWELLRTVHDPEIPLNIVELGLVYDLDVHTRGDGKLLAFVTMTLTAPGCGMGDFLIQDVERALKTIPGMAAVDAKVVFDPIWNPHIHMSEAAKLQLGLL